MIETDLWSTIGILTKEYGTQAHPAGPDPLHQLLWEVSGYLCTDERRLKAFHRLGEQVGFEPEKLLAASLDVLKEIAALGGIHPDIRAGRMRDIAEITLEEFDGDLYNACRLPLKQAIKAFQRFGGIAEPGATKILLFAGAYPFLPLESNGLRCLMRLIGVEDTGNYNKDYRAVQSAISDQIGESFEDLQQAYLLLRLHGKTICKSNKPICGQCQLASNCSFATHLRFLS